jgi:hypothetical protein
MLGDEARHIGLRAQLVASTQCKHVANPLMTASGHGRRFSAARVCFQHSLSKQTLCRRGCRPLECQFRTSIDTERECNRQA